MIPIDEHIFQMGGSTTNIFMQHLITMNFPHLVKRIWVMETDGFEATKHVGKDLHHRCGSLEKIIWV